MKTSGLTILEADGLHSDGWCFPTTRVRVGATGSATEVRVGVWLKPEGGAQGQSTFTVAADRSKGVTRTVAFGQPVEISVPVKVNNGDEVSLKITCPHRADIPNDRRNLSFVMLSLVLV